MEKQQQEQEREAVDVEETDVYEPEAPVVEPPAPVAPATGLLSAAEILAADDLDFEDVPIPEWTPGYVAGAPDEENPEPRSVRLRVMTGDEAIQFTEEQDDPALARDTMIRLVATCAVDENGEQLFSPGEVARLKSKSFPIFKRLQRVAMLLNGLAEESDPEEEKND
jgi:hypothetical protein